MCVCVCVSYCNGVRGYCVCVCVYVWILIASEEDVRRRVCVDVYCCRRLKIAMLMHKQTYQGTPGQPVYPERTRGVGLFWILDC